MKLPALLTLSQALPSPLLTRVVALGLVLALALSVAPRAQDNATLKGFEEFQQWIALVRAHTPGQTDESVRTVSRWDPIRLSRVQADLNRVRELIEAAINGWTQSRGKNVDILGPLLGLSVAESHMVGDLGKLADPNDKMRQAISRVLTTGAMLHTQIALTSSGQVRPVPMGRGGPLVLQGSVVQLTDGRQTAVADHSIHWAIARDAFDLVGPPRAGTDIARAWYHATSASLQNSRNYSALMPHLEHAREVMASDARIFLFSGAACENLAGPSVQVAVLEMGRSSVQSPGTLWSTAEQYYRRALELDEGLAEARLRLGRVLSLQGRHDEAREMLKQAEAQVRTPLLKYYAALFLGRAEQARGDVAMARAAFERARTQWPMAQSPRLALAELAWRDGDEKAAAEAVQSAFSENTTPDAGDPFWTYDVSLVGDAPAQLDAMFRAARGGVQ